MLHCDILEYGKLNTNVVNVKDLFSNISLKINTKSFILFY